MFLAGLALGEQLFRQFGHVVEGDSGFVAGEEREGRTDEFTGVERSQFAILLLVINHTDVRETLEAGSEVALGAAGAFGYSTEFALIARKVTDNEVGFAEGKGSDDQRLADLCGHLCERFGERLLHDGLGSFDTSPQFESDDALIDEHGKPIEHGKAAGASHGDQAGDGRIEDGIADQ